MAKAPVSPNSTLSSKLISAEFFTAARTPRGLALDQPQHSLPTPRIFLAEHDKPVSKTMESAMTLKSIPLSALCPPKGNPRRTVDRAGISSLAESIKADGVLQNLIVEPEDLSRSEAPQAPRGNR